MDLHNKQSQTLSHSLHTKLFIHSKLRSTAWQVSKVTRPSQPAPLPDLPFSFISNEMSGGSSVAYLSVGIGSLPLPGEVIMTPGISMHKVKHRDTHSWLQRSSLVGIFTLEPLGSCQVSYHSWLPSNVGIGEDPRRLIYTCNYPFFPLSSFSRILI